MFAFLGAVEAGDLAAASVAGTGAASVAIVTEPAVVVGVAPLKGTIVGLHATASHHVTLRAVAIFEFEFELFFSFLWI